MTPASPRSRGPVPTLFTGIGSISVKLRSFPHFDIRKLRLASLMKWFRGSVNSVLIFTAKGRRFDSRRGLLFFLENSFSSSLRPPTKNQLFLPTIFLRVYDRLSTKRWRISRARQSEREDATKLCSCRCLVISVLDIRFYSTVILTRPPAQGGYLIVGGLVAEGSKGT